MLSILLYKQSSWNWTKLRILNWFDINKHLPAHYDVDQDEDLQEMEAEVLEDDTVDGTTEIDEVLGDELPKDVALLSVVKRVSWHNSTKVAIH
jgi:hypothetical protein